MSKVVPKVLEEHLLPFDWDVKKVWKLDCEIVTYTRVEFDYLLNFPFWSSKPNQGMLFDISPMEVIEDQSKAPHQYERVVAADLSYPIDTLEYYGRLWILDGVHRIAKMHLRSILDVPVRVHQEIVIPAIKQC